MPLIHTYVEGTYEYVDVSVEDFYSEMSDKEVSELVKLLIEDEVILPIQNNWDVKDERDFTTYEFDKMIDKLSDLRLRITSEDEEKLREILNKY